MSDNTTYTPGTGATVAADNVAGALYQRVKVSLGADGAATDLVIGQTTMAASLPVTVASNQSSLNVLGPTMVKGTQGATGFTTQDLKDAGRVNIMWTVAMLAAAAAGETMLTVTESRDGGAVTTPTSITVTSGKRLCITSVTGSAEIATNSVSTTVMRERVRMRWNTAGATTTASPIQLLIQLPSLTGGAKTTVTFDKVFPDGIEILGDGTKSIGFSREALDHGATSITAISLSITAFEY